MLYYTILRIIWFYLYAVILQAKLVSGDVNHSAISWGWNEGTDCKEHQGILRVIIFYTLFELTVMWCQNSSNYILQIFAFHCICIISQ